MANTMTGRVLKIGEIEEIPSKNGGESFKKRTVVLNCTHSDFGKVYENYPSFEFTGKHLDDPMAFKVDDIVTISFVLQGTRFQKDNQPEKFFNTVSGYKIETYQRSGAQQTKAQSPQQQAIAQSQGTQQQAAQGKDDDLPF